MHVTRQFSVSQRSESDDGCSSASDNHQERDAAKRDARCIPACRSFKIHLTIEDAADGHFG